MWLTPDKFFPETKQDKYMKYVRIFEILEFVIFYLLPSGATT